MIAAIYGRKSNEQEKGASGASESIERQIDHAKRYITTHGWTLGPIFYDDNVSGAEYTKLDGRKRMVAAAEAGAFQCLVVSEQSRLGRDMIETCYTVKTIAESGVAIHAYLDGAEISVEDEVAQALTMLRGFGAATERRQASKRVYDSAVRRFEAGQVAGAKIFGYTHEDVYAPHADGSKPKRLHVVRRVDSEQAAVVRRIFTLYADGFGSSTIARRLNAERVPSPRPKGWQQTTVRGILRNRLYIGEDTWGRVKTVVRKGRAHNIPLPEHQWRRREAPELRIIDAALWDRVQARRAAHRRTFPRSPKTGQLLGRPTWHDGHSNFLITGFGRCATCGGSIRITHRKHGTARMPRRSYICSTFDTLGRIKCGNDVLVRHERLDAALLAAIAAVFDPPLLEAAVDRALMRLRAGQAQSLDRRSQIEKDLALLAGREQRLVGAIAQGDAPAPLIAALNAEEERKRDLTRALDSLAHVSAVASLDDGRIKRDLRARVADVRALLTENVPQGRAMLRKLLDGPIDIAPLGDGRRGFRFTGNLTIKRLITGDVSASLTGATVRDTCAGARALGLRAFGCRALGGVWLR